MFIKRFFNRKIFLIDLNFLVLDVGEVVILFRFFNGSVLNIYFEKVYKVNNLFNVGELEKIF